MLCVDRKQLEHSTLSNTTNKTHFVVREVTPNPCPFAKRHTAMLIGATHHFS